jgi:hypothetical protein
VAQKGLAAGNGSFNLKVWDNSGISNTYIRVDGDSYSNHLAFWTGSAAVATNAERMRITSAGNVGIGTTSPNRKLEVSYAGADNFIRVNTTGATKSGIEFASSGTVYSQLYFNNESPYDLSLLQQYTTGSLILGTNSTEKARIDSSGRLLVGTSTARGNFFGTTGQEWRFQIEGVGYLNAGQAIIANSDDALGSYLNFAKTRGSSVGSNTIVQSGDALGVIDFHGADGTDFTHGARITAEVDGTPGNNDLPTRLVFSSTADGASSPTEAMRINSQQELLVGTATRNANGGVLQLKSGITFPATAVAATDANTLDDYEEGTFTPTQGAGFTITGDFVAYGTYKKIGSFVAYSGLVYGTISGTFDPAGGIFLGGLPFSPVSLSMGGAVNGNQTTYMVIFNSGANIYGQSVMAQAGGIYFSGSYFV